MGFSRISPDFLDFCDFLLFLRILGSGRHLRGILDPVGSILVEYQPERSHMDLVRTIFHDFSPNLVFFNLYICYIETVLFAL